ncbi:MAG TPA: protocatechuate 3,4-dioxygenase subunit alpha [Candidatus Acidoferrales bacterium]
MTMSASQTVGPFFVIGLEHLYRADLTGAEVFGKAITVSGRVLDGDGKPVPDAVLEFWQADAEGNFGDGKIEAVGHGAATGFSGFARIPTDESGKFKLRTILPGGVAAGDGVEAQAPHLGVFIFMRGLLKPLYTRVYFAGGPGNETDPVLGLVPAERRGTLIARKGAARETFEWNVLLQGPKETVFFAW